MLFAKFKTCDFMAIAFLDTVLQILYTLYIMIINDKLIIIADDIVIHTRGPKLQKNYLN